MRHPIGQKGFSLLELMIAVSILTFMTTAIIVSRGLMSKQSVRSSDKIFANQKAIQMFEELLAFQNRTKSFTVLDQMSDASNYYNPLLTTDATVSMEYAGSGTTITQNPNAPSDPLSGNFKTDGNWRYLRQITVQRNSTDSTMRQVNIEIWRYQSDTNPTLPGEQLAQVSGVLHTTNSNTAPTQVLDMYVLAIQNVPGWWGELPTLTYGAKLLPNVFQATNPGLTIRTHYITRTSYGRDSYYKPFTNSSYYSNDTHSSNFPWCYYYPGTTYGTTITGGACVTVNPQHYYDPFNNYGLQITGNVNVDGAISNVSSSQFSGCPSYSCADYFNNALRYPDELNLYNQVVTQALAAAAAGLPVNAGATEISERMLLEGMLSQPQSYENALILNLHGEMMPLPSMRNYSDAAKDPSNISGYGGANIRVVTHPELLFYPFSGANAQGAATFRVYSYYDGLDIPGNLDTVYPPAHITSNVAPVISVLLDTPMNTNLTNTIVVKGYSGNVNTGYTLMTLWDGTTSYSSPEKMSAQVISPYGPSNNQTLVLLYNSPLRCPAASGSLPAGGGQLTTGLPTAYRLYNSEYIPCSPDLTAMQSTYTFTNQDLTSQTVGPKNTARWLIECSGLPVGQHQIETFLGPLAACNYTNTSGTNVVVPSGLTGTAIQFPNLSSTYVWAANGQGAGMVPPWTERYQFMGDPRDCPYLDVKVGGPKVAGAPLTIGTTTAGGSDGPGYNWWFKNLNGTTDGFTGFGAAGNVAGWSTDQIETDLPRYYSAVRKGIMNTTSVFSMICGWSFFYCGYGGEIGGNQPPFYGHIPCNLTPWQSTTTTSFSGIDEILSSTQEGWNTVTNEQQNANEPLCYTQGTASTAWYARAWQGEICPDSMWNCWTAYGNLPTCGNTTAYANKFYREDFTNIHPPANSLDGFGRSFNRSPKDAGINAFCDGTSTGATGGFVVNIDQENAPNTICSLGATCFSIFGFPMPATVPTSSANWRDWDIATKTNTNGAVGGEYSLAPYNAFTTLTIPTNNSIQREFYLPGNAYASNGEGSAVLQISANNQTGYLIQSGFDYTAQSDPDVVIQIAMTEMMRTYLDGGRLHAAGTAGHITQIPLIELYPDQPTGQYNNPTTINLCIASPVTTGTPMTISGFTTIGAGPVTNLWYRWPGLTSNIANYYTEEYPNYGQALTASTYSESVTMDYYLKYSTDLVNWKYAQDNSPAVLGIPDPSGAHIVASSTSSPITYSWNVSNTTQFPLDNYYVEAEAYREQFPLHYACHQIVLSILR